MTHSPTGRFCSECGSFLAPGAKFCSQCGTRVAAPAVEPADEAADLPAAPAGLREKFEAVRSELRGDRREVVILFADLKGFTEISERLDPEEVTLLVHRILKDLSALVYEYEGYVDKFIGDAVMALFGAPLAHEDDPERAILAGLGMIDAIERRNRGGEIPLAVRVGINLGEVVAAHLGSAGRLQYTVLGDAVNVASRLEGRAEPNSVLVSEAVYRRVAQRFEADELEPLELRGKSEPVQAYRVRGYRRAGPSVTGERPFVGREEELSGVVGFLERLESGAAGTLLVEAEAGGGKTRLVGEALARARLPLTTIEVGFSPIRLPGQRPAAREIFSRFVGHDVEDPVGRALEILGPGSETHRSGVEGLAREGEAGGDRNELDAEAARRNRWLALTALLRAGSGQRPVAIVLENLQWIEEEGQELLAYLLPALSDAPVGVLLTVRSGVDVSWLPPERVERIVLGPLDEAAAIALLGDRVEGLGVRDRRLLLRRSQGNPLFLEELARAIEEADEEELRLVPGTLQGLIKSRIDRLDPPLRTLLEMASVLGLRFPQPLLQRMYSLERQPVSFEDALARLEEGGFLSPFVNGETDIRFPHALTQEVAYGGLLLRVRRVLHESAARLGEEHFADRLDAEAAFFAHHYWEAGERAAAGPHLWSAGRTAAETYDLPSAERFLERVAMVLEEKDILSTAEEMVRFSETYGNVLLYRGRLDDADPWFQRLDEIGEREGRPDWAARGLERRGLAAWYAGRLEEAREMLQRGLERVDEEDDPRLAADLRNDLGLVSYYRGEPEEAFAQHSEALRIRRRSSDRPGMVKSYINIGNLLVDFREDLDGAEEHYRLGFELAEEIGDRQRQCISLNNLALVHQDRGECARAIEVFQRAERRLEEIGWSLARYVNLQNQAACEIALGRIDSALRRLRTCLRSGEEILEPINRVNTRIYLFDAYLRALADEHAEEALADARRLVDELGVEEASMAVSLREGRWRAAQGRWHEAANAFQSAAEAARRRGFGSYAGLAEAHRHRALCHAGGEGGAIELHAPGRAGLLAIVAFLEADAAAARAPSAEVAEALRRVAAEAARLEDVGLERAAWERLADVLRSLGDRSREERAVRKASAAVERLAAGLPSELREGFLDHPRNVALRARAGAGGPGSRPR